MEGEEGEEQSVLLDEREKKERRKVRKHITSGDTQFSQELFPQRCVELV